MANSNRMRITLDPTSRAVQIAIFRDGYEVPTDEKGKKIALAKLNGDAFIRMDTYRVDSYPDAIQAMFGCMGLQDKLRDAASAAKSADEVISAIDSCNENLTEGNWSARGTGERAEQTTMFLEAVQSVYAKGGKEFSIEQLRGMVNMAEASEDEGQKSWLAGLRKHAAVQAAVRTAQRIRAEAREAAANVAAAEADALPMPLPA